MAKTLTTKNDPEKYAISHEPTPETPNLDGDRLNFYLLILLYIVQGFPIGLSIALPIILQSKQMVTYGDQAAFSVALWPYSLKLIWAPVVDALYIQWIGRRKSWLLPLQLLMGLLLLYMASNINDWLPETGQPNLKMIIVVIFVINFLSATQDIVVDGWSLTMLKKKNMSYASMCNSVGVPLGMFMGNVCFALLVSEQFCNKYFRMTPGTGGLVTMKSFLYFCGFTTLLITTLVGTFKKEKDNGLEKDNIKINVFQGYKLLWNILKLPRIIVLAIALLTTRIGFTAMDSVSNLKLIDAGISKDDIMLINTMMYVIKFTMPIYVSKYITGPKPMSYYLKLMPFRLLWAIFYVVLIYFTPILIHKNGLVDVPVYYYFIIGIICIMNEMMSFFMLLTLFAFFCRLSDPRFGGTYMTLFNTFYYSGFLLSNTIVLKLVAILTYNKCSNDMRNSCSTSDFKNLCVTNGGNCGVYVDGYYIVIFICMIIGFIWYGVFRNIIKNYQSLNHSHWWVNVNSSNTEEVNEVCIKLYKPSM